MNDYDRAMRLLEDLKYCAEEIENIELQKTIISIAELLKKRIDAKADKKILYNYCGEFIKILRAMEKEIHNLLKLNEEDLKETLRIVNDDLEKYEYLVSVLQRRIMNPIDIEEEGEK